MNVTANDIRARLDALAAAPKTHVVLTTYANGTVKCFEAHSLAAAENFADRERRIIGRDLISRNPDFTYGQIVRVIGVRVVAK